MTQEEDEKAALRFIGAMLLIVVTVVICVATIATFR
jgi:hypothetical protein